MNFGPWLHQFRTVELGIDLRSASDLTGVDPSTINRIENERTQATLATAIRICEGLGIDLTRLVREITGGEPIPTPDQYPLPPEDVQDVLTEADVSTFVDFCYRQQSQCCARLAERISAVAAFQANQTGDRVPPPLAAADIGKFLSESPVFTMTFDYPPQISPAQLLRLYANGGILTFTDVGLYLKGIRREHRRTLAQLQRSTRRSASVLSRLEGGNLERIKLSDVLVINESMSDNNEILGLFWVAAKAHASLHGGFDLDGQPVAAYDLALLYITLCRWLLLQHPGDTTWLAELRADFA